MNEQDFYRFLGMIEASMADNDLTNDFLEKVHELTDMLDEADQDDYFGTGGWKHIFGWNDKHGMK